MYGTGTGAVEKLDITVPDMTLDMVAKIAGLAEAVAVIIGAIVTISTVNAWRKQNLGKRKVELGEQALLLFYELCDNLIWIRKPLQPCTEETAIDEFERNRSQYYNRFMSLEGLGGVASILAGQRDMFRVYFGAETGKPFDAIIELTRKLQSNVRELFTMVPAEGTQFQGKAELLTFAGWGSAAHPDAIDQAIEKAVSDAERWIRPVLEGRKS
jgi:hypothetical protein